MSHTDVGSDPAAILREGAVKHNARLICGASSIETIPLSELIDVREALRLLRSGTSMNRIVGDPPRNPYLR